MTNNELKDAYTKAQELYTELINLMSDIATHYEQEGNEEQGDYCLTLALDMQRGECFTNEQLQTL